MKIVTIVVTHMDNTESHEVLSSNGTWFTRPQEGLFVKAEQGKPNRRVYPWANIKCYDVTVEEVVEYVDAPEKPTSARAVFPPRNDSVRLGHLEGQAH